MWYFAMRIGSSGVTNKRMDEEMLALRELTPGLDARDPYSVSGTWSRVVCFLDYNDLYNFNFTRTAPAGLPREPIELEEGIIALAQKVGASSRSSQD